jgi:hypothetical protein
MRKEYEVAKYDGSTWGVYSLSCRNWMVFGRKREMLKVAERLNKPVEEGKDKRLKKRRKKEMEERKMKNNPKFIENEKEVFRFKIEVNSFLLALVPKNKSLTVEWNPTYGADIVEGVNLEEHRKDTITGYKYGGQLSSYCLTVYVDGKRIGRIYLYRNAKIGHINAYPVSEGETGAYHVLVFKYTTELPSFYSCSTFEEVKNIIIDLIGGGTYD